MTDNERLVLACILVEPRTVYLVTPIISDKHFTEPNHARYFTAIRTIAETGDTSINAVIAELEATNRLQGNDRVYLNELTCEVATGRNAVMYAKAIDKAYRTRELRRIGKSLSTAKEDGFEDAVNLVLGISSFQESYTHTARELSEKHFISLDLPKIEGVPTGFPTLDRILNNLRPSTMNVLAARPAVGKTSLALNIALHAAKKGKRTLIFSLEMNASELSSRFASTLSGMSMIDIALQPDDKRVSNAYGQLSELPLVVNDNASISPSDCMLECRRMKALGGLDFVVIDYIQLMKTKDKRENRLQEVSEITRSIKNMSKELDIPILALSQLSRAAAGVTPRLEHLRESGTIEQDTNVAFLLDRPCADPDVKANTPIEGHNKATLIIAKHRSGPTGIVNLHFDYSTASFRELTTNYN